jgi:small-conductance mechanosensitive channel
VVVIIVIAAFMVLAELNINITPLLAGFGILGVAIGFGAQYLIRDLIGGLFVIMEDQYNIGDVVKISGIAGVVEDINLRRTVLRDLDGIVHFVPNGESGIASNYTREWSRVNLDIEVAYGTDLDHAIAVINHVCTEMAQEPYWKDAIIKTPEVLRVNKLGSSGIEIKIIGDTKPIRQWETMGEIRKRVKKAFDEDGIEIPWPHTKVYFGKEQPGGGRKRAKRPPSPSPETPRQALPPDDQFQS